MYKDNGSTGVTRNLDSFDLEENINVDDVITSFLLRMCLPNKKDNKDEFEDCSTPHAVALKIYEILLRALHARKLRSWFLNEEVYFCSNIHGHDCTVERGCCKRRRFMIAIVEKIISWLKNNESDLQDIDFADDVKLDFGECGYAPGETMHSVIRSLQNEERLCTDHEDNSETKSCCVKNKCCLLM